MGWVITCPWMDFEGGDAVYLDLALRFKQRAGDFIMSRSCVLSHMTMPITSGQRWGNTWFTKANILETPIPNFLCDEPGCSASYVTKSGLTWHKKKDHGKDAAVEDHAGDHVVDDGQQGEETEFAGAEEDDEMLKDGMLSEEEGGVIRESLQGATGMCGMEPEGLLDHRRIGFIVR